jgi:murein peptide amidase A
MVRRMKNQPQPLLHKSASALQVAAGPMHRAHDYAGLIRRWRALARSAGLRLQSLAFAGEHELFYLRTKALRPTGGIYISAGIHGDEPASTEALFAWAEENAGQLKELPLLLFPCLNPWGLINNIRLSEDGLDLNRSFQRDEIPMIAAVKQLIAGHRFAASLMLHEDYDGEGIYLYEVQRETPYWGEALLEAARPIIPIEGRMQVDGRKQVAGLIRRRIGHRRFLEIGYPEAVWLHLYNSDRTFTIETPSEFALAQRVAAHVAVLRECVRRALEARAPATEKR